MTQMTLMTLNLGYAIGISLKQRHKRHQRHYCHAKRPPGVWGTPQKVHVDIHMLCLQNMSTTKTRAIKPDTYTNSYMLQSESV